METEQFEEIVPSVRDERVVMPISSFQAQDEDGDIVEVVGVTFMQSDDENLNFVVIVRSEDGELFPSIRNGVWRRETG